jgi:hypothetical protein
MAKLKSIGYARLRSSEYHICPCGQPLYKSEKHYRLALQEPSGRVAAVRLCGACYNVYDQNRNNLDALGESIVEFEATLGKAG